jgi:hypothetical protein
LDLKLTEWATEVSRAFRVPVSVIEDGALAMESAPPSPKNLRAALDAITSGSSAYRWSEIRHHYVVYPRDSAWDTRLTNIRLSAVPRYDAAVRYVELVHDQVPALKDLAAPLQKGEPAASIYRDRVSLSDRGSVVEHLVELLGEDRELAFIIERTGDGRRMLHFEHRGN